MIGWQEMVTLGIAGGALCYVGWVLWHEWRHLTRGCQGCALRKLRRTVL